MIENYRIQLEDTLIEDIIIKDINLFSIGDKEYNLGNFKSLSEANNFIKQKFNNITYIKTVEQIQYIYFIREFYFRNGKLHNSSSVAYLETKIDGGKYVYRNFYFINNELLQKNEWKKRPEVREIKLKRLLKDNI